ncbi:DUF2087 domain-containing protein [Syntrophobacter fumaroxidans]|uniref:DUF2087 domain-containing protein n=1 Tax=Syntrophobacter fumaroxidans (strain DSM 10017 / MPOB) TaxID=335543 RepID=A0LLK3_SYNFM|nr:DUF2087 domain-containing protein [Syntrophobacter fumaroxidans]ABK18305.1 conserved hypothetical protein [Syntrophobacter fumaroxidans MPOB]
MSRTLLPFHSDDISALARSLKGQLANCESQPSHLELLNMLARANGYRNFQHYRASLPAEALLEGHPPAPEPEPVDLARIRLLLRMFDPGGKLAHWPSKRSRQELCLWVIWSKLPARQVFAEKEINLLLNDCHLFGDHALLRRWLCDYGMMTRTRDGREYRRVEKVPPAEAIELIRRLGRVQAGKHSGGQGPALHGTTKR